MVTQQNNNPSSRGTRAAKSAEAKANKQKKQIIAAICLFVLMGALWGKLLLKKPVASVASTVTVGENTLSGVDDNSINYKELPYVESRHDSLVRDIFSSNGWKGFRRLGQNNDYGNFETDVKGSGDEMTTAAAKSLELVAIVTGTEYQAFIGNKLVVKGQSFDFIYNNQKYVFKVLSINDEQVELECRGTIVVKKMVQPVQVGQ